jgi:hypothetical protein
MDIWAGETTATDRDGVGGFGIDAMLWHDEIESRANELSREYLRRAGL